jgi:hypothetical protein
LEQLYFKLTSPNSEAGLTDEEFEEYKRLTTECNLNERKVLKVGSSQPAMPEPQMQQDMGGMNDMEPMGEEPMQGDENFDDMSNTPEGGSEFDTNFDAGVEADEDEDPKKYIQQLTGKLSQELGKYNNELGEPDEELSKYVGGMIVKQVSKFLNDEDKKELIKKIKTTDSVDDEDENMLDDESLENEGGDNSDDLNLESYILGRKDLNKIFESLGINDILNGKEISNRDNLDKREKNVNKSNKPFSAPKFN